MRRIPRAAARLALRLSSHPSSDVADGKEDFPMVRSLMFVAVLLTALGAIGHLIRASERGLDLSPTPAPPVLLAEPERPLPSVESRARTESEEVYLEEPSGPPLSIEDRFRALEQDLKARDEACRIAEEVLGAGELRGIWGLLSAYAATRDPRIRAGILRGARRTKVPPEGMHWGWFASVCPPGAEALAATVAIRAGLGRHGACRWLAREDKVEAQRGIIDAILDGLTAEESAELVAWCSSAPPAPGIERLLTILRE